MKFIVDPEEDRIGDIQKVLTFYMRLKYPEAGQSTLPSEPKGTDENSGGASSGGGGGTRPASDSQKELMKKLGIAFDENITLADASDLISAKLDKKRGANEHV